MEGASQSRLAYQCQLSGPDPCNLVFLKKADLVNTIKCCKKHAVANVVVALGLPASQLLHSCRLAEPTVLHFSGGSGRLRRMATEGGNRIQEAMDVLQPLLTEQEQADLARSV